MKKALIYWFLFLLILLAMTSCGSHRTLIQKEVVRDSIVETIRDTVFKIEKDSSYYNALLECQNGKVQVKSIGLVSSGRKVKPPKVDIHDNQLTVDCETEAQELFARYKDKFIASYREKTVPVITNELTQWQKIQIWAGRILLGLLIVFAAYKILKR